MICYRSRFFVPLFSKKFNEQIDVADAIMWTGGTKYLEFVSLLPTPDVDYRTPTFSTSSVAQI
jgi:hypothetical protein